MAERTLSVRSSKTFDIAHRRAKRENRTVAKIVELALEAYEAQRPCPESAADFHARLSDHSGSDVDIEQVLLQSRKASLGIDL